MTILKTAIHTMQVSRSVTRSPLGKKLDPKTENPPQFEPHTHKNSTLKLGEIIDNHFKGLVENAYYNLVTKNLA